MGNFEVELLHDVAELPSAWRRRCREGSLFFQSAHLSALESALNTSEAPERVRPGYLLAERAGEPIACFALYRLEIPWKLAPRVLGTAWDVRFLPGRLSVLICGHLYSCGPPGVLPMKAGNLDAAEWSELAKTLQNASMRFVRAPLLVFKDLPEDDSAASEGLRKAGWTPFSTQSEMILDLRSWKSFEDYSSSLKQKARNEQKKIRDRVLRAGCEIQRIQNPPAGQEEIFYRLYREVADRARFTISTLPRSYLFPFLHDLDPQLHRLSVARRGGETVGFTLTLRDGDRALGYLMGFDRDLNHEIPLYFRLLQEILSDSLDWGCRELSFGRTAAEPKARLGALPSPMRVWFHHRWRWPERLAAPLLRRARSESIRLRRPFRKSLYATA